MGRENRIFLFFCLHR
ncbi:hypothetical protein M6B38_109410 [Iris pallida]|uniref:Uncharacterized protein n=1 Tax=Iris pallida TaxID=29817 RepID=A0AAX6E4M9_IRIPA|nr:hypothetical protein M6B38_208770 [Iris pallida]KAJ6800366.1 hypothetical protein M6B38_109410 [Iris pallida]